MERNPHTSPPSEADDLTVLLSPSLSTQLQLSKRSTVRRHAHFERCDYFIGIQTRAAMKCVLTSIVVLCALRANAQNLVPNPSFEQFSACPSHWDQIELATGWLTFRGTPDLYHTCSTTDTVEVPLNYAGYQWPVEGDAYAGIYCYSGHNATPDTLNYREFLGVELTEPLEVGSIYYVSIRTVWTSSNDLNLISCKFASNGPAILFVNALFYQGDFDNLPNHSHVADSSVIVDSVQWRMIRGEFEADSAYSFLVIGQFLGDDDTDTIRINPSGNILGSYYFIDDVCVSLDSSLCYSRTGLPDTDVSKPLIYPNPFNSGFWVHPGLNDRGIFTATLYNSAAKVVIRSTVDLSLDPQWLETFGLPDGPYLLRLENENGKVHSALLIRSSR